MEYTMTDVVSSVVWTVEFIVFTLFAYVIARWIVK